MTQHTFLLDLPHVLESMGFNVEVADGYAEGQGNYKWTNPHTGVQSYDGQPWGYMVHHSASGAATPPPHDTSKASAWIGLWRNGRLYQEGGGTPTIYLASAGPARVSSGYGYRPAAWDHTFKQLRTPAKAQGADGNTALNRYVFNMETVHRGDGSAIDPGVLACVIGLGVALEQMTGLKEMTLGHRSWSQRKIDPYWNGDRDCITQVQDAVAGGEGTVFTHYKIGQEYAEWEDVTWLLFQLAGGIVNPNANSSQVTSHLPYKTNVKLVQVEDFDLIGNLTGMSDSVLARFKDDGMYRFGKESAALKQYAWRDDS